eukprot:Nk52_evm49s242 gene=Nk52_evmTU49s242
MYLGDGEGSAASGYDYDEDDFEDDEDSSFLSPSSSDDASSAREDGVQSLLKKAEDIGENDDNNDNPSKGQGDEEIEEGGNTAGFAQVEGAAPAIENKGQSSFQQDFDAEEEKEDEDKGGQEQVGIPAKESSFHQDRVEEQERGGEGETENSEENEEMAIRVRQESFHGQADVDVEEEEPKKENQDEGREEEEEDPVAELKDAFGNTTGDSFYDSSSASGATGGMGFDLDQTSTLTTSTPTDSVQSSAIMGIGQRKENEENQEEIIAPAEVEPQRVEIEANTKSLMDIPIPIRAPSPAMGSNPSQDGDNYDFDRVIEGGGDQMREGSEEGEEEGEDEEGSYSDEFESVSSSVSSGSTGSSHSIEIPASTGGGGSDGGNEADYEGSFLSLEAVPEGDEEEEEPVEESPEKFGNDNIQGTEDNQEEKAIDSTALPLSSLDQEKETTRLSEDNKDEEGKIQAESGAGHNSERKQSGSSGGDPSSKNSSSKNSSRSSLNSSSTGSTASSGASSSSGNSSSSSSSNTTASSSSVGSAPQQLLSAKKSEPIKSEEGEEDRAMSAASRASSGSYDERLTDPERRSLMSMSSLSINSTEFAEEMAFVDTLTNLNGKLESLENNLFDMLNSDLSREKHHHVHIKKLKPGLNKKSQLGLEKRLSKIHSKPHLNKFPLSMHGLESIVKDEDNVDNESTSTTVYYDDSRDSRMTLRSEGEFKPKRVDAFNKEFDRKIKKRTGWKPEDPHLEKIRLEKAVGLFTSLKSYRDSCRATRAKELEKKVARQREEIRKFEERKAERDKVAAEEKRKMQQEAVKKRFEVNYDSTTGMLNRVHRSVYYEMVRKEKHYLKKGKSVEKLWDRFMDCGKTLDFQETPSTMSESASNEELRKDESQSVEQTRSSSNAEHASSLGRADSALSKGSSRKKPGSRKDNENSWALPMVMPVMPSLNRQVGNASFYEEKEEPLKNATANTGNVRSVNSRRRKVRAMFDLAKRHKDLSNKLLVANQFPERASEDASGTCTYVDKLFDEVEEPTSGDVSGYLAGTSFNDLKEKFDIYAPPENANDFSNRMLTLSPSQSPLDSMDYRSPSGYSNTTHGFPTSTTPGGISMYRESALSNAINAPLMGLPEDKVQTTVSPMHTKYEYTGHMETMDDEERADELFKNMRPVSLPPIDDNTSTDTSKAPSRLRRKISTNDNSATISTVHSGNRSKVTTAGNAANEVHKDLDGNPISVINPHIQDEDNGVQGPDQPDGLEDKTNEKMSKEGTNVGLLEEVLSKTSQEKEEAKEDETKKNNNRKIPLTLQSLTDECTVLQPSLKPGVWKVPWGIRQTLFS